MTRISGNSSSAASPGCLVGERRELALPAGQRELARHTGSANRSRRRATGHCRPVRPIRSWLTPAYSGVSAAISSITSPRSRQPISWPSARETAGDDLEVGLRVAGRVDRRRDELEAALGVGERPGLLQERRGRQDHVGELRRLGLKMSWQTRNSSDSSAWMTCVVFGIGLGDVLAEDVHRLQPAVDRRVEHLRDRVALLTRQRDAPRRLERTARPPRRRPGGRRCRCPGSAPMSEEPWTLFWPRSGSSAEPGRPTLPVIIARLQISRDDLRAVLVLGDAEAPADAARSRPRA